MSAKILSKMKMLECSSAGIFKPLQAIAVKSPIVFKVTVFPPVFGPVIIKQEKSFPNSTEIGTTLDWSISGCLAFFRTINFESFISGVVHLYSKEKCAFAKIKSSFPIISTLFFYSFV